MRTLVTVLFALLLACCSGSRLNAQTPNPSTVQGAPAIPPVDCTTQATQVIATGGTAQALFAASNVIHGFIIQNIDTSEPMWLNFTTTATVGNAGNFVIPPGAVTTFAGAGSFASPLGLGVNNAPSIIAATTGHKFACVKW